MTSTDVIVSGGITMLATGCLLTTNGLCVMACGVCPSKIIGISTHFASTSVRITRSRMSRTAHATAFAPNGSTTHGTTTGLGIPHVNIHFHLPTRVGMIRCFKHKPRRGCVSQGTNALVKLCGAATSGVCCGCIHPRRGNRRASAH